MADYLTLGESGEQFTGGFAEDWVTDSGGDLGKRLKDESSLVHCGMRDFQLRLFDDAIAEK